MRPILRSTPAVLLVLLAAACGQPADSNDTSAETASTTSTTSTTSNGKAPAGSNAAAPAQAGQKPAVTAKLVEARSGRPAMLDTGIDLSHLRDTSAPAAAAPGVTPPQPGQQPAAMAGGPPGALTLVEGEEIKHFGELLEGDKASATYRLKSAGENPLVIERVRPSCGCTAAEIELVAADGTRSVYELGQPIPPGTEFELGASINTANRQGAFASNVAIYSNDPASPLRLQLQADVKPVLEVSPQNLDFGTITSGGLKEGVVTVSTSVLEPFHLELDETNIVEPLSAELVAVDPDAEGRSRTWELKVALGPEIPEGMRRYQLRLKSDVPQGDDGHAHAPGEVHSDDEPVATRDLVCNITANVTALVVASPNFISLGVVRSGEPVERSVKIESLDPEFTLPSSPTSTFKSLTGGEFTGAEYFSVDIKPTPDSAGKSLDLTLRLDGLPDDYAGSFGGMVTVQVNHPTKSEINVRFSGVAKPGIPTTSQDN